MATSDRIKNIFSLADRAKRGGDYLTANRIFVALLYANWASGGTTLHLEVESDGGDPYYDLFCLRFEECYLCIPRPLIAGFVARRFLDEATRVARGEHDRAFHEEWADLSAEFDAQRMIVPTGWLLPPGSPRELWLESGSLLSQVLFCDIQLAGKPLLQWEQEQDVMSGNRPRYPIFATA